VLLGYAALKPNLHIECHATTTSVGWVSAA
jgi:hypothetical protein